MPGAPLLGLEPHYPPYVAPRVLLRTPHSAWYDRSLMTSLCFAWYPSAAPGASLRRLEPLLCLKPPCCACSPPAEHAAYMMRLEPLCCAWSPPAAPQASLLRLEPPSLCRAPTSLNHAWSLRLPTLRLPPGYTRYVKKEQHTSKIAITFELFMQF